MHGATSHLQPSVSGDVCGDTSGASVLENSGGGRGENGVDRAVKRCEGVGEKGMERVDKMRGGGEE